MLQHLYSENEISLKQNIKQENGILYRITKDKYSGKKSNNKPLIQLKTLLYMEEKTPKSKNKDLKQTYTSV